MINVSNSFYFTANPGEGDVFTIQAHPTCKSLIYSLLAGYFFMLLSSSADFFSKKTFFQKHNQSAKQFGCECLMNA